MSLGLHDYTRGVALLRTGRPAQAREAAGALRQRVEGPLPEGTPPDEYVHGTLAILNARLQGELLADLDGDIDAAQRSFARAIELEDAHRWNEPPMLAAGSRLALGRMLLRAGRSSEAEAAFRADLEKQPGSGWALRGLHHALVAQGRTGEAQGVQERLQRAWLAADFKAGMAQR
jgi:tetratricopeptide (TPR) repeat protein